MSYDKKCHELAEAFLSDVFEPGRLLDESSKVLAQRIQDTIEDFMSGESEEMRREFVVEERERLARGEGRGRGIQARRHEGEAMSTLPIFAALVLSLDELLDALDASLGDAAVFLCCLTAIPFLFI